MELKVCYTDGTTDKIISDHTWKTSTGPITYSTVFGGEDYDARNEKTGWDMLQVLSKYGRDDLVGRIHTNPSGPSFGYWVAQGKTNTPEKWDGGGSQQHHMNDAFPEWVCGNLAGTTSIKPGFEEITIKPTNATSYAPDMVSYSLETVRGNVISNWNKSRNKYSLKVTIPVNSTAKVFIPTFGLSGVIISEGGKALWKNGSVVGKVNGVSYHGLDGIYPSDNNYIVLDVGSGTYSFTSSWIKDWLKLVWI